jgi:hypothetical protein
MKNLNIKKNPKNSAKQGQKAVTEQKEQIKRELG